MTKNNKLPDIPICFFYEEINVLPHVELMKAWLDTVIVKHGKKTGDINYIFCTDHFLHALNIEHLQHDTFTDVISFDYADEPGVISGDIYISVERVHENAKIYKVSFERELARVIVHGVLHFLGYDDGCALDEKKMRIAENEALNMVALNGFWQACGEA